jgi:hypothetical protein
MCQDIALTSSTEFKMFSWIKAHLSQPRILLSLIFTKLLRYDRRLYNQLSDVDERRQWLNQFDCMRRP